MKFDYRFDYLSYVIKLLELVELTVNKMLFYRCVTFYKKNKYSNESRNVSKFIKELPKKPIPIMFICVRFGRAKHICRAENAKKCCIPFRIDYTTIV